MGALELLETKEVRAKVNQPRLKVELQVTKTSLLSIVIINYHYDSA